MEALTLFGQPRLAGRDGQARSLNWHAPAALLAFLGCQAGWQPRERLAALLRPDGSSADARLYLRRLIHRTREAFPGLAGLRIEPDRLCWAGDSDVWEFTAAMDRQDWQAAIALQPAALLQSAGSSGVPALDDWFAEQRRHLSALLRKAFVTGILATHERRGDAVPLMQRLAEHDPLDEEAVQFLLSNVSNALERHTAFSAFQTLDRRLRTELGEKPSDRTRELVGALQSRSAAFAFGALHGDDIALTPSTPPSPPAAPPSPPAGRQVSMPVVPAKPVAVTPVAALGRDDELAALSQLLRGGTARLITILGFGGVGKTSMARTLFESVQADLGKAATWVELSAVDSAHAMLDAIAAQIGVEPGDGPIEEQLAHWFAARSHVLFLDNFEQLAACAGVIERLLIAAEDLRLVITSRELLRIPLEYAFPLSGLDFRGPDSPSVRLFAAHAARLGSPVAGEEQDAVLRLVEHLEGVPLAIELAANWTPLLPVRSLLNELKADPAFLDTASAPAARSMQSILAASWRRLDQRERDAMTALSTALGAVNFETARIVAGAEPQLLLGLANKSLLQRTAGGLLRVHPLLREYAAGKGEPDVIRDARMRHAEHFMAMIAGGEPLRMGKFMPAKVAQLLPHVEDLAKAWRSAVDARRADLVARAAPNLAVFLVMAGRFAEISELTSYASSVLGERHPFAASLASIRSLAEFRLGRFDVAEALVRDMSGVARGQASAMLGMVGARVHRFRGEYEAALSQARQAVDSCGPETPDSAFMTMSCVEELALCHWTLGQLDDAQQLLVRALSLAQRYDARFVEGRALALLGIIRNSVGQSQEAMAQLEAAIRIFEEIRDPYQIAYAERGLSYVMHQLGNTRAQFELATRALQTFRDAGYQQEVGESLFALVVSLDAQGRYAEATTICREALDTCLRVGQVPVALRCVGALGAFLVPHDRALGIALMCFAAAHPALRKPDLAFIDHRLSAIAATSGEIAAARATADRMGFDSACRLALSQTWHPACTTG